ncbi:hypothetical protein NW765_002347 [Fusarium oxysporum]|nr:hypothetical protein NW765_002347 [Fusarium oxysporum]
MTPEGEGKGEIPKPPSVGDFHVSSLTWLENHLFLSIHTSNNESPPTSIYHIITRQPPSSFNFQKLTDPVEPFGSDKTPHHSILRLRDFPPALQDMLIVASTAASEMGVLSRSKTPLATDKPADAITGVFTTTEFLDDTKRPTLPMTDSMDDSTPIGVALDLSGKDKVYKPIPSDVELEESPGPLPGFWVLTHEGVLCAWWVVYNDSIRQGTSYPHLAAVEGTSAPTPAPATQAGPAASASPFSNPTPSAFGSASQLGQKSSPWGGANTGSAAPSTGGAVFGSSGFSNTAATSAPAFGKPSSIGFGQSSQLGAKSSPWASASGGASAVTPAFGQSGFSSFANNSNTSPFGKAASNSPSSAPASGGFAGFTGKSGFASVNNNNSGSVFGSGSQSAANPFGSTSNTETAFPAKSEQSSGSPFGSTPFKLQSSFKPDGSAKDDAAKPGGSLFGSNFGSALTDSTNKPEVTTPTPRDEEMDTAGATEETPKQNPRTHYSLRNKAPSPQRQLQHLRHLSSVLQHRQPPRHQLLDNHRSLAPLVVGFLETSRRHRNPVAVFLDPPRVPLSQAEGCSVQPLRHPRLVEPSSDRSRTHQRPVFSEDNRSQAVTQESLGRSRSRLRLRALRPRTLKSR